MVELKFEFNVDAEHAEALSELVELWCAAKRVKVESSVNDNGTITVKATSGENGSNEYWQRFNALVAAHKPTIL